MQRILKPDLRMVTSPALLARGSVAVIGLEAIRDEAGPRWERMRNSIYAHLETLLRQKLGPADYYARLDDLSFLVSVPAATAEEAQVLCMRVAHELHQCLLGQCDIGQLRVARAIYLDGDVLQCEIAQGPTLMRLTLAAGLRPQGAECAADDSPRRASSSSPTLPVPVHKPRFVPVWDVQNEAITTYRCVAGAEAPPSHPSQAKFRLELSALLDRLRYATGLLATHLEFGQKYLLSLPISYEFLGSPIARMEVAALCRSLPSAMRHYLQFEIGELPYGVPQSRLTELVGLLKPFCRGVTAYLPARIPSYAAYQGAGLNAIGLSLSAGILANTDMGSEVFKLAAAAQRLHLRCFVLDIPNTEMLLSARGLNVHALSGLPIGAALDAPHGVKRLPLDHLLSHELNSAA